MWFRSRRSSGDAAGAAEAARGVGDDGTGGGDNRQTPQSSAAAVDNNTTRSSAAALKDPGPDNPDRRRRAILRKLYLRTVPVACLITCATFIDRSNLALAAPVLLHDIGLSRSQFGFASAVMFLSYGLCMFASALMFTVVSLRIWFCAIVTAWGAVTALMAVVGAPGMSASTSFAVLVVLRLALGAAEAGTMPGCFFLLSRFLPKRELAYAYSWVLIFTVLAQVIGAPLGAAFIGPAEGLLGMRGWQVMFIVEGALTAVLGISLPFVISDSVEESRWLSEEEKAWVVASRKREEEEEEEEEEEREAKKGGEKEEEKEEGKERSPPAAAAPPPPSQTQPLPPASPLQQDSSSRSPPQPQKKQSVLAAAAESLQIAKSPQIWALGLAVLLVQTAFFAVTFFAPLLIAETFSKEAMALSAAANAKGGKVPASAKAPYLGPRAAADAAMHAALKSTSVYAPSALALVLAGALCRATGDRKFQSFALLAASAAGFALVPVAVEANSSRGALFSLIVGSCGGVGALAALTTWPDRYVTGRHRCAEYAFWNSFVAVGGFAGPYLLGATSLKTSMSIMAAFQAVAGCILLAFGLIEDRGDERRRQRRKTREVGGGVEEAVGVGSGSRSSVPKRSSSGVGGII